MPLQYRQVIFDLDGTITRSAPGICASAAYAIGKIRTSSCWSLWVRPSGTALSACAA